ncbi:MAG TPA: outer membrane lipoprotein carrier protein LolA [Thermoanaerobaculia bacterium]|nr:outer membrane lipoprotein carrier protein LolA [Thermoanaerobaculia bacterium]
MRRRAPLPAAALLLLLAATAAAQAPAPASSDALALLAKSAAAFSTGAANASPFTQIYTPAGFATARRESGTVWVQAPERLRFDYAAPDVKVFTYDAGEGRFYSPEDKQLTVHRLSADERARLPLVFLEKPDELERRYEIGRDAAGAVVLKPRAADSELAWLKLTIPASGLVQALSYQDVSGNKTEFRFESWKTEKARPGADYRVTGPKGTRTVEN